LNPLSNSVLVAYGDDSHPIPAAFADYANTARDEYLFGQMPAGDHPSLPEGASLPAIVLYKQFDEGFAVLPPAEVQTATTGSLADFVKSNAMPLFDEITPENFGLYASQGTPIAYVFVDPEQADTLAGLVTDLTPLAKEHKGKINFVYIDGVKFVEHGKSLNLPGDNYPAFVVQDLAAQTKFPLAGTADAKSIREFVAKFAAGEIAPSVKSEPIPETQGPVYKLVADGWDELVKDDSKDILAEYV
jgi:protein disulfide-isomerase A1